MRMSSHKGAGKSPNGMIYIETADQGVSRNMVVPASATDSKSSLDLVLFSGLFGFCHTQERLQAQASSLSREVA